MERSLSFGEKVTVEPNAVKGFEVAIFDPRK